MTGDPTKVPRPPKFGPQNPGPTTLADWVSFWRWLINLWRVASEAVNAVEVVAITPRQQPQGADENALGAAQTFAQSRGSQARSEIDGATIQALTTRPQPFQTTEELAGLIQLQSARIPYPQPREQNSTTLEGLHAERGSAGGCNVSGTTITRTSGTPFMASMVGNFIAIQYILYRVVSFTSTSVIDIDTNIGVGSTFFLYTAYPSTNYVRGSFFVELDRSLLYVSEDATGVVDVSGTTVTHVSGDYFYPYWAKQASAASIVINGVSYPIDHLNSSVTALTLLTSAGTQTGVSYTVYAGKWQYISGQYYAALSNIPTDIGPYDEGLLFFDTTKGHILRWNWLLNTFQFAPGDTGSGYVVAQSSITSTIAGYFGLCDGSTYDVSNGDGTTRSVITPDFTGGVFMMGWTATGTQQAATRASWEAGAKTDMVGDHHHSVFLSCGSVGSDGSPVDAALCGFFFDTQDAGAHDHTLSDANALLKVPSEANGGLPLRIRVAWYIRL